MAQIQIQTTSFIFTSYNVFVCDVYGNQCVLVANVLPPQPPTIVITIPSQFNTAPAVGIKLIDSLGCEILKIVDCTQQYLTIKQFQDGDDFYFMDNEEYDFQT
jgi:hypothetical protein